MELNLIERILIVGLGSIGKRHLRIARKLLPKTDIRVLKYSPINEVPNFADGCFFNLEEALAFGPQLAVIANPAPFHIGIAQELADNGVHLLVEKPLATELDGISRFLDTCQKHNLTLSIGYNLRFSLTLRYFRDLINKEIIGKVLSVNCEVGLYLPNWRPSINYQESVSARRGLGGGVLLELSHEIDYLRWLFGEIEWVKATLSRQSKLAIDVEDTAYLILGFEASDDGHKIISTLNLDFIRHDPTRLCTVIGEKGSLRWNGVTDEVQIYTKESSLWKTLYRIGKQQDESYISEWRDFLESIETKKSPMVTGRDGLKVLEVIEASRRSHKSEGKIYRLENIDKETNS